MQVTAAFYPLQYAAQRVAGDHADVVNLTQPGSEPHDLELTVRETAEITAADLVVHEAGFQPAVDAGVEQNATGEVIDVASALTLSESDGTTDPHFWQDPLLMADLGDTIAERLADIDDEHADEYAANAADLRADLESLDAAYSEGLVGCERDTVVVSHDAFGYLAKYGLTLDRGRRTLPRRRADTGRPGKPAGADPRRRNHHRLLRAARQPRADRDPRGRPGDHHRDPRPDRGADRRNRGPGLPFPDGAEPHRPSGGQRMPVNPIELSNGAVAIGGRPVLRAIDLTVSEGEFVALMGANGSGKSTLVRALTGLRPLLSGDLRLFGTPFDDFHDWHRIGFVPQRQGATSGVPASVWEVVASGRLTRRRLLRPLSRADRTAIADAIEIVGLSERTYDGVAQLSGGQQQRVLIARALAGEPELFFLDEPMAGVDLPNQLALAEALARLKHRNATIVLVAHELGPLTGLVDRAVAMRDGRIAYDGPPLADHEVHEPWLGEAHTHHHPLSDRRGDHAPQVSSPLEGRP